MGVFILWILGAIIVGGIGAERDCGFIRGFLISLFLSPIIGAILVAFCPKKKTMADMLAEAKVFYESNVINEDGYNRMVNDITEHGKIRSLKYYK